MAKAAWCTVAPMTGKENAPINITLPAYTGRLARNTIATATNKNGTKPSKAITVNQAAAGNILTLDATKPDVATAGGSVTVNGTSNSSKLNWYIGVKPVGGLGDNYITLDIPGLSAVVKVNNTAIVKYGHLDMYLLITWCLPMCIKQMQLEIKRELFCGQ